MRPSLTALEDRLLLSTIMVESVADTMTAGAPTSGTLRWAVGRANAEGGAETIAFDPAVFNTPRTITLAYGQLELSTAGESVTIAGPAAGLTIDGGGLSRVFQVDNLVTASLSGLTITGGSFGYDQDGVSAGLDGGGGLLNEGSTSLVDCTISGNYAYRYGGGISNGTYADPGASLSLINCTVSNNSTSYGYAAGLLTDYGTTTAINTIIAGNSPGATPPAGDLGGSLAAGSTNNLLGGNPMLAPLGDYGGTGETMPPLPGSPALDAGTGDGAPAADERGEPRVGPVDIGAFESQGFQITPVPGSTPQSADIGTAFANPLAVTVTANNPVEPVDGGIITFVAGNDDGATAILSAPSAVIAGGQASVTAMPDDALGRYSVSAMSGDLSATFDLANTGRVISPLVVNTTSASTAPGVGLLSLPEAVLFDDYDPSGNSPIRFDAGAFATPETITLAGSQLELSNAVGTIAITGPAAGVTVDGGGLSRVLQVDANVTASLSGLTIADGSAGSGYGGGLLDDGTATLMDCTITGNGASDGGGVDSAGSTTLIDCSVTGNSAVGGSFVIQGGGLLNSGTLMMAGTTVDDNTVYGPLAEGGGLFNSGTATVADSTFSGNSAMGTFLAAVGGGVSNGGLFGGTGAMLTLTGCTISDDSAVASYGSGPGGGLLNYGSTATLTGCTISGNAGGGVAALGEAIEAFLPTGVAYFITPVTTSLTDCTISGNAGGGLTTELGTTTAVNTTIANNSSYNGGGVSSSGFYLEGNDYDGTTDLTNCTVSGNSATGAGGGVYDGNLGVSTLVNTIVALNTDPDGADDIAGVGTVSGNNNLIGTGGSGGLTGGVDGNLVGVADPLLAPLGNYGGPTQTVALLPGSPAIDAGTSAGAPTTDERGLGPVGGVDIGAVESQGFTITVAPSSNGQSAAIGSAFASPLTVIVTPNDPDEPVDGGVVTFAVDPSGGGASATLSAASAVISGGQASVTATAVGALGPYTVSASADGMSAAGTFDLTNAASVVGVSVDWGAAGTATLLTAADGLHLLPAGRNTDLPWSGIREITLTLDGPAAITAADIRITGINVANYGFTLSVSGSTCTITLLAPIDLADRITLTIAAPGLATYVREMDVLPGDVNDDGVVNAQDQVLVRNAYLGIGPAATIPLMFLDVDGDGTVDVNDYSTVRKNNGTRLP